MVGSDISFEIIKSKKNFPRRDTQRVGWSSRRPSLKLIIYNREIKKIDAFTFLK
jgi:hypothetical protein